VRFEAPGVRIADVATCDFALIPSYETDELLRLAQGDGAERYLASAAARRLMRDLGVVQRHLTHVPNGGHAPKTGASDALDLAFSAVERLRERRSRELERLDALIFVSTSNPNPVNCQASILAERCGLTASCLDMKAGCSGGLLAIAQAGLMIRAGCERVLVVMAETLSRFTPADDLRMLLTVGDGAAAVLVERADGPGFLTVIHGTEPTLARSMTVATPFPPNGGNARYVYEFADASRSVAFQRQCWPRAFEESLSAASVNREELNYAVFHQTHLGQILALANDLKLESSTVPIVVDERGNMGTPTAAVALASVHQRIEPGQKYLLGAVGGGVSWCFLVAEHR